MCDECEKLNKVCQVCNRRIISKRYYDANKEKIHAQKKQYYKENKERYKLQYQDNKESIKEKYHLNKKCRA